MTPSCHLLAEEPTITLCHGGSVGRKLSVHTGEIIQLYLGKVPFIGMAFLVSQKDKEYLSLFDPKWNRTLISIIENTYENPAICCQDGCGEKSRLGNNICLFFNYYGEYYSYKDSNSNTYPWYVGKD